MVSLALILPALWAATTGPGTVTAPERDPLVFAAREGWRARLMYVAEPERALRDTPRPSGKRRGRSKTHR